MEILEGYCLLKTYNRTDATATHGARWESFPAGCPGIAIQELCSSTLPHHKVFQVVPLSGPYSMFMALMASGFFWSAFACSWVCYPIDKKEKAQAFAQAGKRSDQGKKRAQIFMERLCANNQLLERYPEAL